jgi:hypothetical protein
MAVAPARRLAVQGGCDGPDIIIQGDRMDVGNVVAVVGLGWGVFVFALTRWERRRRLRIVMYESPLSSDSRLHVGLKIRVTNPSRDTISLDVRSQETVVDGVLLNSVSWVCEDAETSASDVVGLEPGRALTLALPLGEFLDSVERDLRRTGESYQVTIRFGIQETGGRRHLAKRKYCWPDGLR